jgi:hypothetical protein
MRRPANVGAMGLRPRNLCFPDAEGPVLPEGSNKPLQELLGEEGVVSGGVFDHGTSEEDGPVTWEASPRRIPVLRRAGEWSPTHGTYAGTRVVGPLGHRTSVRLEVGQSKGNQSCGRWGQQLSCWSRTPGIFLHTLLQTRLPRAAGISLVYTALRRNGMILAYFNITAPATSSPLTAVPRGRGEIYVLLPP